MRNSLVRVVLSRRHLMRWLFRAAVGGICITALSVLTGLSYRRYGWDFGIDHVAEGRDDLTYYTGWVELPSGETEEYDHLLHYSREVSAFSEAMRRAKVAGWPRQSVGYSHRMRGFPFLCIEFYWNTMGPHGSYTKAALGELRTYPEYRFGRIRLAGFFGDVAVWTCAIMVCATAYVLVRTEMRRRRGLCLNCGYQTRGLSGKTCPECGDPHGAPVGRVE